MDFLNDMRPIVFRRGGRVFDAPMCAQWGAKPDRTYFAGGVSAYGDHHMSITAASDLENRSQLID